MARGGGGGHSAPVTVGAHRPCVTHSRHQNDGYALNLSRLHVKREVELVTTWTAGFDGTH